MSQSLDAALWLEHAIPLNWRRGLILTCTSLVFVLALILRLDAVRDDLWLDELQTAWIVQGSWSEIPARAAIGNQAPLYFYLVKAITRVAGVNEGSLRSLSLLAGAALIVTAWCFVQEQTRSFTCALVSLIALGFDKNCLMYSSEARPYAMMQLVLAWHLIFIFSPSPNSWRTLGVRALLSATALHLHLTSLLVLAPIYIGKVLLVALEKDKRRRQLTFLALELSLVAVLAAPLVLLVIKAASHARTSNPFVPPPSFYQARRLASWTPLLIGLSGFVGCSVIRRSWSNADKIGKLLYAAFAPVLLALSLHLAGVAPLFFRRYLLGSTWLFGVLPGVCLAACRARIRTAFGVAITAAVLLENSVIRPQLWASGRLTHLRVERWGDAVRFVSKMDPRGELPLFVASEFVECRGLTANHTSLLRDYCCLPVVALYRVPQAFSQVEPASFDIPDEPPAQWIDRVKRSGGGIWVLRVQDHAPKKWMSLFEQIKRALQAESHRATWSVHVYAIPRIMVVELRRNSS